MKIKTSELEGAALDWAVAQRECQDNEEMIISISPGGRINVIIEPESCYHYRPSTDWSHGGPLIDRYDLEICAYRGRIRARWMHPTRVGMAPGIAWQYGQTALIAAMRAIVASEVGDEVDVPEELL